MSTGAEGRMSSGRQGETGFTYLAMLFFVAVVGAGLAATSIIWSQSRQREKEVELLWIGEQFRQAIALYYHRTPGALKRYPEQLEELLQDRRYLSTQRYLRRIYRDPFTGEASWGLVPAPGGGIMGVHSQSQFRPIKSGGSSIGSQNFQTPAKYSDWRFIYEPVLAQPLR